MIASIKRRFYIIPTLVGAFVTCLAVPSARAADYYIDPAGNDSATGTSAATPWKTLAKVNATTFLPGDNILFKKGGSWTGSLQPQSSGNSSAQITLGSYGTGAKPLIDGAGGGTAISLSGQSYWTIDGFEVTNQAGGAGGNRSGIRVGGGGDGGTISRIRILNNDVHDIQATPNVNDGARNWGGIFVWIDEPGKANDVQIQGNTVTEIQGQGISFWGEWENGPDATMNYANCSPNVVVRGNRVWRTSGDGILVSGTTNELVEYNEVAYVGALSGTGQNIAAAWPTRHVDGIWQYNHVHHTASLGANDSTAFDNDGFVQGTTYFQYNYTHDNQGGFHMEYRWVADTGKTVSRYNISVNDGLGTNARIYFSNRPGSELYNNVFYNPGMTLDVSNGGTGYHTFRNNIFVGAGRTASFATQGVYYNNTFNGGVTRPTSANSNVTRDPLLVSPNTTGNLAGFLLQSTSSERSTGVGITSNGSKDFWSAAVPASTTAPHRGASQINAIGDYTATPTFIQASGPSTARIPPSSSYKVSYSADVRDQNFRLISSPTLAWSIIPAVSGLSIDSNGVLSIGSAVAPQRIAVVATSGSLTRTWSVSLINTGILPLAWNNGAGTGKWNASDANWSGNSWIDDAQATFSHIATPQTVTIEGARSAAAVLVGNGGNNANYTFTSAAGGSLATGSVMIQGSSGNDSSNAPLTTFDNATVQVSGNLGVGRAKLLVKGNTALTAGAIGGNISGISSADWGCLTLQDTANVTATNGVTGNTTAWGINLNGGTLTTSGIQGCDFNYLGAYLYFNGGLVRANQNNTSFVTLFNGSKAYVGSGGAKIDTNGYNIGIGVPLANASTASPTSNGGTTLTGTGSLTKQGSGTLTLSAANTYTGPTTISGGTLRLSVLGGAARHFDAASLGLANAAAVTQWNDLSGNGANANVPSGNANPTYLSDSGTGTGLGAVSFLKNSGASNSQALGFSRDTAVRSIFSVFKGSGFLLTDSQSFDMHRSGDDNPADPLLIQYGQIDYLGTVRVNGSVVAPLADAMPTSLHNGFNMVSLIGNGNPMEIDSFNKDRIYHAGTQSHAETVLFDSVIDDTRRQQIEAYLAKKWFGEGAGVGNLLPATAAVTLSNGGTLDLGGVNFQTLASVASTDGGGSKVLLAAAVLTVGDSTSTTFDGAVSGFGSLVKQGAGTLTLSGNNSYSGGTTVNGGRLDVASTGTLGSGNLTVAAGAVCALGSNTSIADSATVTLTSTAKLELAAGVTEVVKNLVINGVTMDSGTWNAARDSTHFSGTGSLRVVGIIAPAPDADGTWTQITHDDWRWSENWLGNIIASGVDKTATFAQSQTVTVNQDLADRVIGHLAFTNGTTTIAGQVLKLDVTTGTATALVDASRAATISASLTGTDGLTKTGAGTLTLSGNNSFSGGTTITGGTLNITGRNVLPGTGGITITAGAILMTDAENEANTQEISSPITLNGGTLATGTGTPAQNFNGGNPVGPWGNFHMAPGASILAGNNATSAISAMLGLNGSGGYTPINVDGGSTLDISGNITGVGYVSFGGFSKSGAGTLVLRGNNKGASQGMILFAGTVEFSTNSLPTNVRAYGGPGGYSADIQGNATLRWASGNTQDISFENGSSQIRIGDGVTATFDTNGNGVTLGTAFDLGASQTAAITKTGLGMLTLSGTTSYTGNTTVQNGMLRLGNGVSPTNLANAASVIVAAGAMLDLSFTGTDQVHGLWVDGLQMPPGVYSSTSGFITGGGSLTVTTGPASTDYATWSGRGIHNLAGGPSADDDNDSIANLLEYVLGGNPRATSSGILPSATASAGNLIFSFRRIHSTVTDTTQVFQHGTDLSGWADVPVVAGGMVAIQPDAPQAGTDTVTITVPEGTQTRVFGRLKVSAQP